MLLDKISIEKLKLNKKSEKSLLLSGYTNIEQIKNLALEDLIKIKGIGVKSGETIIAKTSKYINDLEYLNQVLIKSHLKPEQLIPYYMLAIYISLPEKRKIVFVDIDLQNALNELFEFEKLALTFRLGLDDGTIKTVIQTGELLGSTPAYGYVNFTESYTSFIIKKAKRKMQLICRKKIIFE